MPSLLLQASIIISFLTLAVGITSIMLNLEKFPTKMLATLYCLASLIARFAAFTAVLVEFGYGGLYLIIPAFFARVFALNINLWVNWVSITGWGDNDFKGTKFLFWVFQPMLLYDHVLTFIVPFGKAYDEPMRFDFEMDMNNWDVGFVGFNRPQRIFLAMQGPQYRPLASDKFLSPLALANLALTLLENSIGWLCVCLIDSNTNVTMWYFHMCGLLMMGLMPVTLALTYASLDGATRKQLRSTPLLPRRGGSSRAALPGIQKNTKPGFRFASRFKPPASKQTDTEL